jgi:cytoskeletal protein RodZ
VSTLKKKNVLLIVFVVFTLLFGSLFAYEFVQVQQVKSQSTITSTTTVTSTSYTTKGTNTTTTPHIGNLTTTSTSVQSSSLASNTTTISALNSTTSSIRTTCTCNTTTTSALNSTTSSTCFYNSVAYGVNVRVLSDSGSPISGVQISGTEINPCGNYTFTPVETNSSGVVTLPPDFGSYNVTITYQGHLYNVNIPMYPITLTEVTMHVPSGVFSVEVVLTGNRPIISGPSFATTSGGPQLNVTLGSYTVH